MKTFFHGEVIIIKSGQLPLSSELKKTILFDYNTYKLADSETTGNHHLLEAKDGAELFEDNNGVLWLKNEIPCNVFCAVKGRHNIITLEPGIWKIDKAQEYDYLTEMTRNISD